MARPGFGVHMEGACIRGGGEEVRSVTSIDPTGVIFPVARTAPDFVRALFNDTALYYDTFNRLVSLGSGSWYRRRCLIRAGLKPGQRVLDVAIGTGLIHIPDLEACFCEFRRVLKLGGTLLLLEISKPAKAIYGTILARYLGRAVPRLSHWLTRQPKVRALMTYHWETMESCAAPTVIDDAMKKAGFAELVCEAWFDLFRSYVGQRPRL
jgi:demethylmenaquinone methyltransferase/2-methoxy-6-polyprenyl-1,4-benzoquinol methylase